MPVVGKSAPEHGNSYNIFILILTIFSLIIMVLLLLPWDEETIFLLLFYDNLICVIFLADFANNLYRAPSKRGYFINQRGWLDLIGSIPTLGAGVFRFTALLRLARLSRLARIGRLLGGKNRKALIADVLHNRGQYALFITVLLTVMVLTLGSLVMLQVESRSDGSIQTGGDALWWALVTITTVGYGDYYPVTTLGRFVAAFVMFAGVGIIGALASILASLLVTSPSPEEATTETAPEPLAAAPAAEPSAAMAQELAAIRAELTLLRQAVIGAPRSDSS